MPYEMIKILSINLLNTLSNSYMQIWLLHHPYNLWSSWVFSLGSTSTNFSIQVDFHGIPSHTRVKNKILIPFLNIKLALEQHTTNIITTSCIAIAYKLQVKCLYIWRYWRSDCKIFKWPSLSTEMTIKTCIHVKYIVVWYNITLYYNIVTIALPSPTTMFKPTPPTPHPTPFIYFGIFQRVKKNWDFFFFFVLTWNKKVDIHQNSEESCLLVLNLKFLNSNLNLIKVAALRCSEILFTI